MVAAKISNIKPSKHARSIDLAVAQPQAAEMLNVSVPSVKRAKKVQESGESREKEVSFIRSHKKKGEPASCGRPELRPTMGRNSAFFSATKKL
jgi:hypothetical protein